MKFPRREQNDLCGDDVGQGVELTLSPSVDELERRFQTPRSPSDDSQSELLEFGVELFEGQIPSVDEDLSERLGATATLSEEHQCPVVLADLSRSTSHVPSFSSSTCDRAARISPLVYMISRTAAPAVALSTPVTPAVARSAIIDGNGRSFCFAMISTTCCGCRFKLVAGQLDGMWVKSLLPQFVGNAVSRRLGRFAARETSPHQPPTGLFDVPTSAATGRTTLGFS